MADIVILLIVAVILVFAVLGTIKHFKGEGPCCGGGSTGTVKEEKKKLEHAKIGEKIIRIQGMHCENCRRSVTNALNDIEGVSADVSLKKNRAVVSYDRPVEDSRLRAAVEQAGFHVLSIQ